MASMKNKSDKSSKKAETAALSKQGDRALAKPKRILTIHDLEQGLLKLFPADTAEAWDRTGLLVGEGGLPAERICIALDPTVETIRMAASVGASVLITHHPAYLEAPDKFAPEDSVALATGANVWEAIRSKVALMCFHTALDVSRQAQTVLPNMLGIQPRGKVVEPLSGSSSKGYGQICSVAKGKGKKIALSELSARCVSVFGRMPRVWGSPDTELATVVTCTGSAGGTGKAALAAGADALICGEIKYHEALALSDAGMAIIELGHDTSEFPLTAVLAQACVQVGANEQSIVILDQPNTWYTPEAIRL